MHVPPTNPAAPTAPHRRRRSKALGFAALAVSLLMAFPTARSAFGDETGAVPGGGDLGPNVLVFDPSTPDIQGKVDEIFKKQESAQFGSDRYALMFKPGTYNDINAQIGFYTSIAGLGLNPDDTTFNGDVTVDAGWFDGNATQNFWRSAENLALDPVNGTNRWAVSQAAPFRRMHVKGGLNLAPDGYGWASGGYIADSKIDGQVGPYSQQQWYTRDSYARGTSWADGTPEGESIPLDQFYVVKPGATAQTINAAVDQGLHLLFTPGVYHVDEPIEIDRANTVALGLGLATIIPDNGVTAIKVGDVDGVKLAGLLVDAGPVNSSVLVEVGPEGSSGDHAANPTSLQDVFVRIGGAGPGKATTSIVVNSDDTIIDHTWVWRADHGEGVGWETNRADYGVHVKGDDVLATGLFVEHFNKYDVRWSGENGKTIFFQNEKAYDAPNQAAIQNGDIKGYAGYKVDDSVTTHEGWGMGSYCFFDVDPTIRQQHGFQAPVKPGVKFHDLLVVSLGGKGQYDHVINDTGSPTSGDTTVPSQVVSFP
ncbi:hypothetical protein [[Kitasatospora] papulosa]|uniref:hypothetical protein n=1 Tax=[Kitasatospora] papulosa TaxID=1464011 RepID=UPI0004BE453A|nr:hypothetical protein [[Kitasatospora] papulosa]